MSSSIPRVSPPGLEPRRLPCASITNRPAPPAGSPDRSVDARHPATVRSPSTVGDGPQHVIPRRVGHRAARDGYAGDRAPDRARACIGVIVVRPTAASSTPPSTSREPTTRASPTPTESRPDDALLPAARTVSVGNRRCWERSIGGAPARHAFASRWPSPEAVDDEPVPARHRPRGVLEADLRRAGLHPADDRGARPCPRR